MALRRSVRRAAGSTAPSSASARAWSGKGSGAADLFLAAHGPELRGFTRGPTCRVPEPEEAWLAVLGAALPFRASAAVVCLDSSTTSRAPVKRGAAHFRECHACPLMLMSNEVEEGTGETNPAPNAASLESDRALIPPELRERALQQQAASASDSAMVSPVVSQFLARSPFGRIGDGVMDTVVYLPHTFRQTLPWAEHYITDTARILRPHGVMAIMAESRARLVGPQELVEDFEQFKALLDTACPHAGVWAEEDGFVDMPLPFSHVQRRAFTSEYPVTSLAALAAYVRSWPQYLEYAAPRQDENEEGVLRGRADPLVAFMDAAKAQLEARGPPGHPANVQTVLRLEVDLCVVTADNRPSNRPRTFTVGRPADGNPHVLPATRNS
jgi:hypothetical protein